MKHLYSYLFLFFYINSYSQELINNGDFELFNSKKTCVFPNINGLRYWKTFDNQILLPSIDSYHNMTYRGKVNNLYVNSNQGKYFLTISTTPSNSEYIYCKLKEPLKKGKYILSMDVSRNFTHGFEPQFKFLITKKIPTIDLYITYYIFEGNKINCNNSIIKNEGIIIKTPKYLSSQFPFKHIEIEYNAKGGECYLVLGYMDNRKIPQNIKKLNEDTIGAQYYIDNVSLKPISQHFQIQESKIKLDTNNVTANVKVNETLEAFGCDTVFNSNCNDYYVSKESKKTDQLNKLKCHNCLEPFLKSLLLNNHLVLEIEIEKGKYAIESVYIEFQNRIASYFEYYGISSDRIILKRIQNKDGLNKMKINLTLRENEIK